MFCAEVFVSFLFRIRRTTERTANTLKKLRQFGSCNVRQAKICRFGFTSRARLRALHEGASTRELCRGPRFVVFALSRRAIFHDRAVCKRACACICCGSSKERATAMAHLKNWKTGQDSSSTFHEKGDDPTANAKKHQDAYVSSGTACLKRRALCAV